MRFGKLALNDFMSYAEAEISLSGRGLVLVKGENRDSSVAESNGAGKSVLVCDGWCWVAFGKTARGVVGSKVVRRGARGGCCGVLEIVGDSGEVYRITRYQDHRQYRNALHLHKIDFKLGTQADLTRPDKRETQKEIERLIGFPIKVALNAMVLGQSSIAFASMTDSEKKETLERVLGFDRLVCAQQRAKDSVKRIEASLISERLRVESLSQRLVHLLGTLEELQLKFDEWEASTLTKRQQREAKLNEIELSLRTLSQPRVGFLQKLFVSRKQLHDLDAEQSLLRDVEIKAGEAFRQFETAHISPSHVEELNRDVLTWASTLARTEHRSRETKDDWQHRIRVLEEQKVGGECPTCGQDLPPERVLDVKDSLKRQLEDVMRESQKASKASAEEIDSIKAQQLYFTERHSTAKCKLADSKEKRSKLLAASETLDREVAELEERRSEFGQRVRDAEHGLACFDLRQRELETEKARLEAVLQEVLENPYTVVIANQGDPEEARREFERAELKVREYRHSLDLHEFWVEGFGKSGIQSYMLDSVTPYLSERASKRASVMLGGEVAIAFRTQRELVSGKLKEDFHITVENRYGADAYAGSSAGERERVDICIALAVQDLVIARQGRDFGLCVLDEVVCHVDALGVELYYQLLQQLAQERDTVFVVTHSPHLEALFPKVWVAVKEGGVSRLVRE